MADGRVCDPEGRRKKFLPWRRKKRRLKPNIYLKIRRKRLAVSFIQSSKVTRSWC